MNKSRFVTLSRFITAVGFVVAAAAAQAGGNNVYWSVNVDAPTQGNGRLSTSFSNTRHGMRRDEPVIYAPAPVVIHAPGRVYYRDHDDYRPRWRGHRHWRDHHHHRHHHRHGARVVRNVHNGLARMHEDMAHFHARRADAWSGGGRRDWRDDDRRGGYYGR